MEAHKLMCELEQMQPQHAAAIFNTTQSTQPFISPSSNNKQTIKYWMTEDYSNRIPHKLQDLP
jgi:hypothetical protein